MALAAKSEKPAPADAKVAGAAATLAAAGALACGVCCVLPFALPAAVLGVSGGALAWFAGFTPWATGVAIFAVAAAWLWVGRQTWRTRRRPRRTTLATLVFATALLSLALAWPGLEGVIAAALRGG